MARKRSKAPSPVHIDLERAVVRVVLQAVTILEEQFPGAVRRRRLTNYLRGNQPPRTSLIPAPSNSSLPRIEPATRGEASRATTPVGA